MGFDISTVVHFEGHELTFLQHANLGRLLRANDLAEPMETTSRNVRKKAASLEPEDRVELQVPTPQGPQEMVFLTPSGTLQVLATGRSRKCARLRKVVCDFFVKNNSAPQNALPELARSSRPHIVPGQRYVHPNDPLLTPELRAGFLKEGFMEASEFLKILTGVRQKPGVVTSYAKNVKAFCLANDVEFRWAQKSNRPRMFMPVEALYKMALEIPRLEVKPGEKRLKLLCLSIDSMERPRSEILAMLTSNSNLLTQGAA